MVIGDRRNDARPIGNGSIPEKVLNKLLGQALVDRQFRQQLLADPDAATERFDLTDEQRSALSAIEAHTLSDFALQLHLLLTRDGGKKYKSQDAHEVTPHQKEDT